MPARPNRYHARAAAILLAALFFFTPATPCPSYTRKDEVHEGVASQLPNGWYVFAREGARGLYRSPVRSYAPEIIPSTNRDTPSSIHICDNGEWIVYIHAMKTPYLIRVDGTGKTEVPVLVIPGEWNTAHAQPRVIGFLRQSPFGTELFYYDYFWYGVSRMRAIQVDLSGATPVFGTDRILAEIADSSGITPDTSYFYPHGGTQTSMVVGDQIFAYLKQHTTGREALRNGFITIPDAGKGTAGPQHIYRWANDTYTPPEGEQIPWLSWWGCAQTMSHDGRLCLSNSGYIGSACVPNKRDPSDDKMDHKGFYITRFLRYNEPPIPIDDQIDNEAYGISINWCPPRLRTGTFEEVDFNYWNFSNASDYVVGTLSGSKLPLLGEANSLWVVHWPSNTWTRLTPSSHSDTELMVDPALYLTEASPLQHPPSYPARKSSEKVLWGATRHDRIELDVPASSVMLYCVSGKRLWGWRRGALQGAPVTVTIPPPLRSRNYLVVIE